MPHKGYKWSTERREQMSELKKDLQYRPFLNHIHSKEARDKISSSRKGKHHSSLTRIKIAIGNRKKSLEKQLYDGRIDEETYLKKMKLLDLALQKYIKELGNESK